MQCFAGKIQVMVEVKAKELQYTTNLVKGLQDKVHLVGVIKPEIHQTIKTEMPNSKCKWYGFEPHDRRVCPAREATCNYRHALGHYKSVCCKRTKKVHYIQDGTPSQSYVPEFSDSTDFLGYLTKDIGGVSSSMPSQDVTVKLNGIPTSIRIDTGVDVTVINKGTFDAQF